MKRLLISAAAVSSLALGGCSTDPALNHQASSTAAGAVVGAGAGAIAGSILPGIGTGAGAVAGAVLGGAWFLKKNIELVRRPDAASAMRCFHASLAQLSLLLAAAMIDAALSA